MRTDDEIGAEAARIHQLVVIEAMMRLNRRLNDYTPEEVERLLTALSILGKADRALTETEVRKILRNG